MTATAQNIEALLARIDERTENTQHRLRNLEQKLEAQAAQFVPRVEIERMAAANAARVASLEDSRNWLIKSLGAVWIAGGFTVLGGVWAFVKAVPH